MLTVLLACVAAAPEGAQSPEALQAGIAAALESHQLWRVIDYVQPADRDVFLAQLDDQASFAAISGGAPAFAELQKINERFGVAEHDWPRLRPVAHAAQIEEVYAGVADPRGLAEALAAVQAKYAPKPVTIAPPTLNASYSAMVFASGESPIVQVDGRYYIEEPDPAEVAASRRSEPPPEVDPFAGWDLAAIADRFQGRTWLVHGDWSEPVQAWRFDGATIDAASGDSHKTLSFTVTSPCSMTVSEHTPDATFETDAYFGWDGDTLHLSSSAMGYRERGAIVVCSDRGTVVYKDGRCDVWLKLLSSPWSSSQVTCTLPEGGFDIEGDVGSVDLVFRGEALVNGHYEADGATARVDDPTSAQSSL